MNPETIPARAPAAAATPPLSDGPGATRSAEELAADLKIHQVELEMQNQELREAQASLEASRQRYFSLFDLAPVPYLLFNEKHGVAEMNLAAGELIGIARGELWQRPFAMHLTEESRPIFHEHLRQVFAGTTGVSAELRLMAKGGRLKHVVLRSSRLEAEPGRSPQVLTAASDVTAAKEAEQRQKTLENELRQSQKMEALGILAGGMAHDFNNILQAINGFADIALLDSDPELMRESIEQIRSASQRASQLTRQILAFGRRQPIESSVLSVNDLLESLAPMLDRLVRSGVKVRSTLEGGLPAILADRGQIEQVIMNLVLNACDSMAQGGIVEIRTVWFPRSMVAKNRADELQDAVGLVVRDSGTGMAPETLARIFEPFFTTKPRALGTGLGLAVVHGIVQQHGGEIRVESRVGQGTTFTILLPATDKAPVEPFLVEASSIEGRGQWILLAEDEPALLNLGERLLQRSGFRVLKARDGAEAVEMFHRHVGEPLSLLLFDVLMPKMTGLEAYKALRDLPDCPPVLFVSGFPGDAPIEPGQPDQVRFLRKPFRARDLLQEVVRCLRAGAVRETGSPEAHRLADGPAGNAADASARLQVRQP
jgi:PAS domain S-box-containing protein